MFSTLIVTVIYMYLFGHLYYFSTIDVKNLKFKIQPNMVNKTMKPMTYFYNYQIFSTIVSSCCGQENCKY